MSAYSAQSFYTQGPAASSATAVPTAYPQPGPSYTTGTSQPPSADQQSQPQQPQHQPQQPQSQHSQSPQPQQAYYYNNPAYSQQPAAQQPPAAQQATAYYGVATPAAANPNGAATASHMYMGAYGPASTAAPGQPGAVVASVSGTDMGYAATTASAYPPQYQFQHAQLQQQPYQAGYIGSYPAMQPYQYLQQQQQQQQQQQAMYQQQYHNAYHTQQSVAMMPTITDPTGQKPPPNIKPKITTTLWEDEGTLCFQVEARGICVARREDNNMVNGTKLLNVAGMTRGRRDGILKGEKNRHVVKAGAMHLKGVWIPYERALDFANREKIIDLLYPLFVTDLKSLLYHPANFARTAQVLSAAEKRKAEFAKANEGSANGAASPAGNDDKAGAGSKPASPKVEKTDASTAQQPPSQQSMSGRFSVDRMVSNHSPSSSVNTLGQQQPPSSSTPPATTSSTPTAAAAQKPYYYSGPNGAPATTVVDQYAPQPSSAYISPTSRISTPVSANQQQQQPQDMAQPGVYGMHPQRYPVPPAHNHYNMYPQHAGAAQPGVNGNGVASATSVPLVSPVSSTSGGPPGSTPTPSDPAAQHYQPAPSGAQAPVKPEEADESPK